MKLKEKITIQDFEGKSFKVRIVESQGEKKSFIYTLLA